MEEEYAYRPRNTLSLKDTIQLSPIEKHIYHNKPPYRFLLNLALLILVTIQVSLIFSEELALPRAQNWLLENSLLEWDNDESPGLELRSVEDIQTTLTNIQDFFENIDMKLFQTLDLSEANFYILSYDKYPFDGNIGNTYPYDIRLPITNPFDASNITSIQQFFDNSVMMVITGGNIITSVSAGNNLLACYNWTLNITFDNQALNLMYVSLVENSEPCNGDITIDYENTPNAAAILYLSIAIFFMSFISIILLIIHYTKVIRLFMETQSMYSRYKKKNNESKSNEFRKYSDEYKEVFQYNSWAELPYTLKIKFVNGWRVFNFLGNLMQFFSSFIVVSLFFFESPNEKFAAASLMLGIGVFFAWVQMLEFFEYWDGLILISQTFEKSSKEIKVFWMLVIPIGIGYAMVGYSFFWKYDLYDTFGMSLRTLFALSCGDTVHESFETMINEGVLKQIWIIIAVLGFYTAAQNLFYVVILEGYERAKIRTEFDKDDPFPTIENLLKEKLRNKQEKEEKLATDLLNKWEEAHQTMDSLNEILNDDTLEPAEKFLVETLLAELKQVLVVNFFNLLG